MILAIPVVDGHHLTKTLLESLAATVTGNNFRVVIVDNNSVHKYQADKIAPKGKYPFPVHLIHNRKNTGYYVPLKKVLEKNPKQELIGLIHNDMVIYEHGWNERMEAAFAADTQLGLVGLCGSNELDERGGRGGGTMCFFRGGPVQVGDRTINGQAQAAGLRITDVQPSCVLDSLFMMFRREVVPKLVHSEEEWLGITLAHFYDRIWPCRVIEAGYRVATMGVECDHLGGMTTTANERYRDDCIKWLEARNIPYDNPETEMYLVAERAFLSEYREGKKFLPCKVGQDYGITHYAR